MNGITFQAVPMGFDIDDEALDLSELEDKTADVKEAAQKLDDGARELQTGAQDAVDGGGQLAAGSSELESGAADLQSGMGEIVSGGDSLAGAAQALSQGISEYTAGVGSLTEGIRAYVGGAQQLGAGASPAGAFGKFVPGQRWDQRLISGGCFCRHAGKPSKRCRHFDGGAGCDLPAACCPSGKIRTVRVCSSLQKCWDSFRQVPLNWLPTQKIWEVR